MSITLTIITGVLGIGLFAFVITYFSLKGYIHYAKQRGIMAPDVHKKGHPQVVDDSGVLLPLLLLILFLPPLLLENFLSTFNVPLSIFSVGLLGYVVGFIDDQKDLGLLKVPIAGFAGLPLIVFHTYSPFPLFPLIGRARFTIIYPILIILIVAVISNGVNMIDVVNGSAITQSIFAVLTIIFWSFVLFFLGSISHLTYVVYASPIIGILVGFFFFNRFPAKIFLGNSGAYGIGAMIAALVIVTRKEFVTMIALLPMILNAFIILVSIRGVKTKEDLASPVNIKDGKIFPNRDEEAPLTLVGLRASVQPVRERDVIRYFNILFVLSFFFALVTGALIYFQKALPMLPL